MKTKSTDTEVKAQNTDLAKAETNPQEIFNELISKQFTGIATAQGLTSFQTRLVTNYYLAIDAKLTEAEQIRLATDEKNRDKLPFIWENVDRMEVLARNVATYTRVGYDPSMPNHINISFQKTELNKYEVVFIEGYKGLELKAKKYGLNPPDDIIVELVYKNDYFVPLKKDMKNRIENYEFEIKNPFDRGDVIGGFYYLSYNESGKNKLVVFSLKDILKRKPKDADEKYWGTEKGENGETISEEGWRDEMFKKTITRAAYYAITIDSSKIDEDYTALQNIQKDTARAKNEDTINKYANKEKIEFFDEAEVVATSPTAVPQPEKKKESADQKEVKIENATFNADGTIRFSDKAGF